MNTKIIRVCGRFIDYYFLYYFLLLVIILHQMLSRQKHFAIRHNFPRQFVQVRELYITFIEAGEIVRTKRDFYQVSPKIKVLKQTLRP